ncbi:GNAT family N-acetyltransferase [Candidatus Dependentiae bacterium]|nr:GNAT family N-acetyltransferase [Candidatus Dependentiae bacterium]
MYIKTNRVKFFFIILGVVGIIIFSYIFRYNFKSKSRVQKKEVSESNQRPAEIKGKIVTLKRIKPEYFEDFRKILSPAVTGPLYFPAKPSFEWTKNFLEKTLRKEIAGELFFYLIFDNKDNKLIGFIDIRERDKNGQFGVGIHENYWGKGRFKEAVKLITEQYFKIKNKPSFIAHVEIWNLRSFYALKSAGFTLFDFYYENGNPTRYILKFNNPKYKDKSSFVSKENIQ